MVTAADPAITGNAAESPGVQIRRFGGAGERSEISIRGFASSQVVVALDGVPLNSVFGGGVDLSAIPVELLESVEVQRPGATRETPTGRGPKPQSSETP